MAITEEARFELYTKLEQVLGREEATVLMEHLPPLGWADVATKHDLAQLEERLEMRFQVYELKVELKLEQSLGEIESRLLVRLGAWFAVLATIQAFVTHALG